MFQLPFTQLQQMPPGAWAMLGVALGEACQTQPQLIVLAAELDRTITQNVIGCAVLRFFELYLDAFCAKPGRAYAG
ncbi:hypothetical protein D3C80_1582400 [compost metagenome]